jgi:hypothetical protein
MICTPVVCWVHPTAYTMAPVRSGPELAIICSATSRNCSLVQPHTSATISGV